MCEKCYDAVINVMEPEVQSLCHNEGTFFIGDSMDSVMYVNFCAIETFYRT